MKLKVTQTELLQRLSSHKIWFAESQHSTEVTAHQLSIVDAEISDINISNGNFSTSELVRCVFNNATFKNCDFSYSLLIRSCFKDCNFLSCSFVKADMKTTDFSYGDLS